MKSIEDIRSSNTLLVGKPERRGLRLNGRREHGYEGNTIGRFGLGSTG
jgi:hypothetical protein